MLAKPDNMDTLSHEKTHNKIRETQNIDAHVKANYFNYRSKNRNEKFLRTEVETSRYSCKKHSCRSMVLVRFYSDMGKRDSFVLAESMQKSTIEANSKSQSLPSKNASKFSALDCVDGCLYIFSRLLTFHLVSLTFDMV